MYLVFERPFAIEWTRMFNSVIVTVNAGCRVALCLVPFVAVLYARMLDHSPRFPCTLWRYTVLLLLADELLAEKEKYKAISEELDTTFAELAGF